MEPVPVWQLGPGRPPAFLGRSILKITLCSAFDILLMLVAVSLCLFRRHLTKLQYFLWWKGCRLDKATDSLKWCLRPRMLGPQLKRRKRLDRLRFWVESFKLTAQTEK
jgi:hypothetical protein